MNTGTCPVWLKFGPPDKTFGHIGVAIGSGAFSPYGHVGLIHREREQVRFLHLAWHFWLQEDELQSYAWVVTPLLAEHAMLVAARCRSIARKHSAGIPYAPKFLASRFDDEGELVLGKGEHGFTCATFILAVFEHAGLPLVSKESWPSRTDDQSFVQTIVKQLNSSLAHLRQKRVIYEQVLDLAKAELLRQRETELARHIENVDSEVIDARFRPEEVAAASSIDPCPASFEVVIRAAQQIVAQFECSSDVSPE